MPSRYVLTGAPCSGKTVLLRALAAHGQTVVEEAATDVIIELQADGVDEPWTRSDSCDRIVAVQRRRQTAPVPPGVAVQFFDRSPLCTLALARYLGRPVTRPLAEEVVRVAAERVFEPTVFLVRPLEAVHEAVYQEHCYALVDVHGGPVAERREFVQSVVSRPLAERSGTA